MDLSPVDHWICAAEAALRTLSGGARGERPPPLPTIPAGTVETPLDAADRRLAGALMRVNHVGEVCAQALYQAQALATRDEALRTQMAQAAREEIDHLA